MKTRYLSLIITFAVTACGTDLPPGESEAAAPRAGGVFVQLFEWRWPDVARECENVLGPAGYAAVQVSPPQEHVTGRQWWTRYQPVSYRIESRGGTRAEFADMVRRCQAAGVAVYADAIINHMAGADHGTGVAGSDFSEYSYPVPYDYDDFHHCGRNDDDMIENYQDLYEVQHCQLAGLDDLDTGKPAVQAKIAAYLNDLLGLGVAGFRLDAAKHIADDEIAEILALVEDTPFVYQEVIDRGGEPINAADYLDTGFVIEFKYPLAIVEAFKKGNLEALDGYWKQQGWLPADRAIVFVDNHDIQRGHAGSNEVVSYKDGAVYDLAVTFMLAHPYGYPMVMSSYAFENDQQGPPASSPLDAELGCGKEWICEHRRRTITGMVGFRRATYGAELDHWQVINGRVVSFSRGDKGHIVINTGNETVALRVPTGLPAGDYDDLLSATLRGTVDADSILSVTLDARRAFAILSD